MAIMNFIADLVYYAFEGFYYICISLLTTGKFLFLLLNNGCNGLVAAFNFVPTCMGNSFDCTFKALQVFMCELIGTFDNFDILKILICFIVVFTPFLREIVSLCLVFLFSLTLALLFTLFKVTINRRPRVLRFRRNVGNSKWSIASFKNAFKNRFKSKLMQSPTQSRPHDMKTSNNRPDALVCLVCYDQPKCVLLMPCKHVCLCIDCSWKLLERKKQCPLCQRRVTSAMRIYI